MNAWNLRLSPRASACRTAVLAKAEVARLSETVKEMAVKLMLVHGKAGGAEWPGPAPGRRGHQGRAARPAR